MIKDMFELVLLILIFLGILALTYYITKKMALLNKRMAHNKNMEVVEMLQIVQGQYLCIVKIGRAYHLIGSSQKGNICYCTNLNEEELNLEPVIEKSFSEQLSHFMKGRQVNEHENEHKSE